MQIWSLNGGASQRDINGNGADCNFLQSNLVLFALKLLKLTCQIVHGDENEIQWKEKGLLSNKSFQKIYMQLIKRLWGLYVSLHLWPAKGKRWQPWYPAVWGKIIHSSLTFNMPIDQV